MCDKIFVKVAAVTWGNGESARNGWGSILTCDKGKREYGGNDKGKTKNHMVLVGILNSLKAISNKTIPVEVYTDIEYIADIANGKKTASADTEIWNEIFSEKEKFADVQFFYERRAIARAEKEARNVR